ncbi:sulfate adenylyltransferase subunit CysN [Nitrosospira multiformis]|uniref:Sulfate adenylyltransferase subunit 1 n=1 Tax=Nitrosospira multiformis (strain ATCC 25196 / NCIMB 11849 / C 71) TaxID=323848 RepID=Q2Y9W9_NITMU|nr:sulfate adenylyltransferase subunit CysN [Nitrosospira multiformis]ABB74452.1 sulfate adenylyltransferase subunit 1 [Nitrosospira multiformis ATCC 25196]SEA25931.1 sulfate adenylyltransferase subunit 1 [Nitrosospira multiformis]SEF76518.1 sulfate adenylyltransferase subunit 1 [Nitrosospira multiformis ATCC 25196]
MSAIENISFDHSELLRFITAGSVDDGKSTLIGRLLHDSKSIFEDQLSAITHTSRKRGMEAVDLSLLTDGLQAEREQGITIDVAYRYFATPKRKFIIADTPGHEQYTRNMVTGASTANLAIILIDARKGVLTQSRRHAYLASLVGIPHLVVAVNKMDLVNYSRDVFERICQEFHRFVAGLNLKNIAYIPMSALNGDMVVERGNNLGWYEGMTLMDLLEKVPVDHDINLEDFRFPVQLVCRPQTEEWHDFRGYMGRIESGSISVGDEVQVLPSGLTSRIKEIVTYEGNVEEAVAPQSVTLTIEDHLDISRGDMLVKISQLPQVTREFDAMLCWLSEQSLDPRRKYLIKHSTRLVKAVISRIEYRLDINTLKHEGADILKMNDIARVSLKVHQPLVWDAYQRNHATGSFIVIDEVTNNTVAAGMICPSKG